MNNQPPSCVNNCPALPRGLSLEARQAIICRPDIRGLTSMPQPIIGYAGRSACCLGAQQATEIGAAAASIFEQEVANTRNQAEQKRNELVASRRQQSGIDSFVTS